MDPATYQTQYHEFASQTEQRLQHLCDCYLPERAQIGRAARYSLLCGGKRVRAVLVLASARLCGADWNTALDYAAAIEMLHCYSLIHDDLPCMDNDDYRRGRLSCHKQFGESTALLAADALVTAAFEVLANAALPAQSRAAAAGHLAFAGGARGMLFGQELDKRYETCRATEEQLLELHAHKTGALIIAAAELGCDAADAADPVRTSLRAYAAELGLVFQIVDDILDVTSTTEELGKPVGSDAENDKTTFVTLYGLDGARTLAQQHNEAALRALDSFGPEADFLREMARELLKRNK
ncbi:MAG: farnesyl diphosphate synthase [Gemmiger sp.]|uniref:polyprenyl synthetase family protein n=1 Tax=Gemmiger sp. TaxID=2049027 RepID=UPI002E77A8FC|nr:farnesyl diphosphate synthase [Gemmiger sp.]MEE0801780.1 farnesyl diphosphate synthase [Gemmiger sp.]